MLMKEAALIQSAAVAMPLATGGTPPPAAEKSLVEPARAQMAMPTYSANVMPTIRNVQV